MKKISIVLLSILLVGCSSAQTEPTVNVINTAEVGEYAYVLPFESTEIRYSHVSADATEIGAGMERYAKKYFPVDEYYAMEGQIISDYDSLFKPLIKLRESEENPQGLNPSTGSLFDTGTSLGQVVLENNIILDLFEMNFLDKDTGELAGIAITLVARDANKTIIDGVEKEFTIGEDQLYNYMSNAGRKLESYMRNLPLVGDVPIMIALYNIASSDDTLAGGFIGEGLFEGRLGQFNRVSEEWVLYPSVEAFNIDATVYTQFNNFKSSLTGFIEENIGVIAKGLYVDDSLNKLIIQVNTYVKTYSEAHALTQYCIELLNNFTSDTYSIVVEIKLSDETISVIQRDIATDKAEVIYLD